MTPGSSVPNMPPAASELYILPKDPLSPEALFLLREAAIEARRLYADLFDPAAPMPTNAPAQPGSIYLIAFSAENPVGCGALRKIDEVTGEVRRMYVLSSARRSGIGRALLARLEEEADKLGYTCSSCRREIANFRRWRFMNPTALFGSRRSARTSMTRSAFAMRKCRAAQDPESFGLISLTTSAARVIRSVLDGCGKPRA
jgi:GNAT superfamily N-acetyltransferase